VRDTDDMVNIREGVLEELVGDDAAHIGKTKERVIREAGLESHGPGMENGLMT